MALFIEQPARFRKSYLLPSLQKLHSDLRLQLLNLHGHGGLRIIQLLCRPVKASMPKDCLKGFQRLDVHSQASFKIQLF
jgi:hypothetical protein